MSTFTLQGNLKVPDSGHIGSATHSEAITIDSSGNVGIGTTPNTPFQIKKSTSRETGAYDWRSGNALSHGYGNLQFRITSATDSKLSFNMGVDSVESNRCILQGQEDFTGALNLWLNPNGGSVIMGPNGTSVTSDDRLKENEENIQNAIDTLMKLKPQLYDKKNSIDNTDSSTWLKECGLISQEVYYDAPELRYLVIPGTDINNISTSINTSEDPSIDPDYSSWGNIPAALNYNGFIAYLIKAVQELKTMIDSQQATIDSQQATIDSQQAKTATLETQVADLLARVTALENP